MNNHSKRQDARNATRSNKQTKSINYRTLRTDELPLKQSPTGIQQFLPTGLGKGVSNSIIVSEGLRYIETRYQPNKNFTLLSEINALEPSLIITLAMQGYSSFTSSYGQDIDFKEGHSTITVFNASQGKRQYTQGQNILQLRLAVTLGWLRQYFEESQINRLMITEDVHTLSNKPLSSQSILTAKHLLNAGCLSKIRKLELHNHALSILACELSPLFEPTESRQQQQATKDAQIAKTASAILQNEYRNPPSVQELAKRCGTNQLKLKQIFHTFFDNTPYGVLLDIRMKTAYQLLESKRSHVAVVADQVGYRHASNFSTAFLKYFGTPPKRINR